jgi:hypothetical protein
VRAAVLSTEPELVGLPSSAGAASAAGWRAAGTGPLSALDFMICCWTWTVGWR